MKQTNEIVSANIQSMIFTICGVQVMVDSDLAAVYWVETKILNRADSPHASVGKINKMSPEFSIHGRIPGASQPFPLKKNFSSAQGWDSICPLSGGMLDNVL